MSDYIPDEELFEYMSENELMHYGMPRRSGRYPWGSGKDPYQHAQDFLGRIESLEKKGFKEKQIADELGLTTTQYRVQKTLASNERRALRAATARRLRYKEGKSLQQIAKEMGYPNDSSVRNLLNEDIEVRKNKAQKTADFLKNQVDEKGMIDVGKGVELGLNVSREKLEQALYILEREGYPTYGGRVPQVNNKDKYTTIKILCPPGSKHREIYNYDEIHNVDEYITRDDGETYTKKFVYPKSIDSKRVMIRYAEDGGKEMDGVIELRRNVEDLNLGESRYAQTRILVDGTHYLKGMAIYSTDEKSMPKGVDIIFNTNKSKDVPKMKVLKEIKKDPDNPFGALLREEGGQSTYIDKNGKRQLSAINKTKIEGDWSDWKDKLPSQFLAKQSQNLIDRQLNLKKTYVESDYDKIMSCTNPVVKKQLLWDFAEKADKAAVELAAAALPRQKYQVILPIKNMKDTEVYAPNYKTGERVALIRYPHGGKFEIPILTVNNKHVDARKILGNSKDAVGINSKIAAQLSGADYDGDTVMVIPTNSKTRISNQKPLEGLKGFDPSMSYPGYKGMKVMRRTDLEMGKISNLITDMTLKGANPDELSRAVRHSMVVIDAEKHKLDYRKSYYDNGIGALKKKYQERIDPETGKSTTSAATLISRAKAPVDVVKRVGSVRVNPETGEKIYKERYESYREAPRTLKDGTVKEGKIRYRTTRTNQMSLVKDAHELSSGTAQENAYADFANAMKAMANKARKEWVSIKTPAADPAAKKKYAAEVASLNDKLKIAQMNAPKERRAQMIATSALQAKKNANPNMTKKELKKQGTIELTKARQTVGASGKGTRINITDKEWEAIQSNAISGTALIKILRKADSDRVNELAIPKNTTTLSNAQVNKIKAMANSNFLTSEIAKAMDLSESTVRKYLS